MKTKRITASLLCAALALPAGSLTAFAEDAGGSSLHIGHFDTYEQYEKACLTQTVKAPIVSGAAAAAEELPAAYDLRKTGHATAARDQELYGTCWSFAAMASIESALAADVPETDLSEWHLAYYSYADAFGYQRNDNLNWFNNGGNFIIVSSMLSGWLGPVEEADCPYDDWDVLNADITLDEVRAQADYHVTDAVKFAYTAPADASQLDEIKRAIHDGHAVSMSFFEHGSYFNKESNAYYFSGDLTEEESGGEYHAISVIGWDDAYPAENFLTSPSTDGAWLCKNSWGEDWGDCGYFWLSYAEPTVYEAYYLKAEPAQQDLRNYQYDDYGCGVALSVETEDTTAYMANIFTAEEDTYVTDVMVCTALPEEQYEVTIYTDLRLASSPTSGTASAVTSGTLSAMGYQTITLAEPVKVDAGEQFSVVVRLSGEAGQHITSEAAYRSTSTFEDGTVEIYDGYLMTMEMLRRDFHENESFYSPNGRVWHDMYDEVVEDAHSYEDENGNIVNVESTTMLGNVCVKAIASPAGAVIFSTYDKTLPQGTEISLTSPGGGTIYYSTDGGENYIAYEKPIVFDSDMTITAYVDGIGTEYTQSYTLRYAKLSYLNYSDGSAWKQLAFTQTADGTYEAQLSDLTAPLESLQLYPVTSGTVVCGETALPSGEKTEAAVTGSTLTLTVSKENCLDTEYVIRFGSEQPAVLRGDTDNDGAVTAADAAQVLIYAAAVGSGETPEVPDEEWTLRADYDEDGDIDAADAAGILIFAAKAGV